MNSHELKAGFATMKMKDFPEIDLRLIIFIILMLLLPFILFSKNGAAGSGNFFSPMPIDTIGVDTIGIVRNYEEDTLDESYPGIFSSLYFNLLSIPADTVIIYAYPDAQLNLGAGAGVAVGLIFPPYPVALTPQQIKVKPVDDAIYEEFHSGLITFSIEAQDTLYEDLIINDLAYFIEDNDLLPGINFNYAIDTFLTEGLTGVTWLLSLNSIPADTVYVTADPDVDIRITGIPDEAVTLVFPPNASSLSWQDLMIRAYDDNIYEGFHSGTINMSVESDDVIYNDMIIDDVTYDIYDNDSVPGLNFSYDMDTFLTEGLTGIPLLFSLHSIPSDTVFLTVDPDFQMRITGIPDEAVTLVFPPNGSALTWQSVSIRAYDDDEYEGTHTGLLQFDLTTADTIYDDFFLSDILFSIEDNDAAPGIDFSVPAVLELNEWEGELDITIALQSVPADTVKIIVYPDEQLRITAIAGEPYELVFAPNESALNDHIANVKAFNDFDFEGTHTGDVTFEIVTTDIAYAGFTLDAISISIFDDDLLPGIIVNDTADLAQVEGDTTLSFSMALSSIPQFIVTINADPDAQLDLGKGRDNDVNFKFKGDSALLLQYVKVIPYDDFAVEGPHIGKIGFSITTDDPNYILFNIDTVIVEITDNDGVSIATYAPDKLNIYPTVSSGIFYLDISALLNVEGIQIYNTSGAAVFDVTSDKLSNSIDLSHLASGSYIVIADCAGVKYWSRIEIMR